MPDMVLFSLRYLGDNFAQLHNCFVTLEFPIESGFVHVQEALRSFALLESFECLECDRISEKRAQFATFKVVESFGRVLFAVQLNLALVF